MPDLWIADHEGSRPADPETDLLVAALADLGVTAQRRDWHQAGGWDTTLLTLVRSTWDYTADLEAFLSWARSVPGIENPAEVLAWSSDKAYLLELGRAGVPTVETVVLGVGERGVLPEGPLVAKPAVGAGSKLAKRFGGAGDELDAHLEAIWASGSRAVVQAEVPSVAAAGELDLVFLGGDFHHAVRKGPMLGREHDLDPSGLSVREDLALEEPPAEAVAVASQALAALEDLRVAHSPLLYARVDLFEQDGGYLVSELELVEPALFLHLADGAPERLAGLVLERLDAR